MKAEQQMVQSFHERMGAPVSEYPQLLTPEQADFRARLIEEETREYREACEAGDLVQVADALGDLAYVLLGTAVEHGIELEPVFHEVHRSNMTKEPLDPVTRKGGKGPSFQPPRLEALLVRQRYDWGRILTGAAILVGSCSLLVLVIVTLLALGVIAWVL
jgi:predicted HAD superfamily Cof-like phosphohydrolase